MKKNRGIAIKIITAVMFFCIGISTSSPIAIAQTAEEIEAQARQQQQELLNATRQEIAKPDPTINTPPGGAGIPMPDLADAAFGCLGSILSNILGTAIADAIGWATDFVSEEVLGGIFDLTVPVSDKEIHAKEIGQKVGPVTLVPSEDAILYCVGNLIIESVLRSTTEWVKSGFNGKPAFVDNPEKFFLDIADKEVGAFLDEISNGFLCSPWDVEIRLALLQRQTETELRSCTLSEVVDNMEKFIDEDFNEGGWRGWFVLTQEPNNNPYGAYYLAENERNMRSTYRQNTVSMELTWGKGFLGMTDTEGNTSTPGNLMEQQISKRLGLPEDRLSFADEFDELLGAFINQMLIKSVGQLLNTS